ncbi:2-hydroxycyclohexanecarboxyl-CoA dehydrogenase [Sphingomonas panacis]|uniref:2-hydroxycyclohexanecarboxyl-CoA dehydrogenase n=1 Tax=Sphingomonas panacis TaxID=1560345 RepID=A0A1B3ZEN1_9SPHN|nr:SDR family NAD(P)-dependent oxidoreductase [Sphingomonas panacis]AOH85889.1 2-hydroxycyclohexanecarboxyl-CoA dehydrogenase [Sphingomonas panacis]
MAGRFNEKSMVVTGAASGIGKTIAKMAAEQGAHVFIADINEEGGKAVADEIRAAGGKADFERLDLTNRPSIDAFAAAILAKVGALDILVNSAGWDLVEPFLKSKPETWDLIVAINYLGPVHLCHHFVPGMMEKGGGKVVNISSDAGRIGSPGEAVYSGAKGGIISFTKTLAREVARGKVNVNCIAPGPTNTPLYHVQSDKLKEGLKSVIPFRRVAEPEEIANAVLFFASGESDYITGQTLSVSGGMSMVN